jgi:hypothetical protein
LAPNPQRIRRPSAVESCVSVFALVRNSFWRATRAATRGFRPSNPGVFKARTFQSLTMPA